MNHTGGPPGWAYISSEVDGQRVLTVMEECQPWANAELRAAWDRRRQANITGRCECGAEMVIPYENRHDRRAAQAKARKSGQRAVPVTALRDGLSRAVMFHEPACPAGDKQLRRLVAAPMN
jgi:hypothetical protein